MPAVKITQKPIGTPGDDTHFIVTQPELPEGYTPTGQETEEELEELKVESVREIEMDDMVELIQEKLDMDVTPTTGSSKPVTSGGIKAALDLMDDDISSLNEDITNLIRTPEQTGADFYICDPSGNVLAEFRNGHLHTKNFDSADALTPDDLTEIETAISSLTETVEAAPTAQDLQDLADDIQDVADDVARVGSDVSRMPEIKIPTALTADLYVVDANGNVLVEFSNGHVKTKNFDSSLTAQDAVKTVNSTRPDANGNVNVTAALDPTELQTAVDDFLTEHPVVASAAGVVSVADYGAVGDGTTDDSAAIQRAVNANYDVYFESGKTYYLASTVTINHDIKLHGGKNTVIKTQSVEGIGYSGIIISGTQKLSTRLTSDYVSKGASSDANAENKLTLASTEGIAIGDIIEIVATDQYYSYARRYYYLGGVFKIVDIYDGCVYIDRPMPWNITNTAKVSVKVFDAPTVDITNLTFEGDLDPWESGIYQGHFLVGLQYCKDSTIENCNFTEFTIGLSVRNCVNTVIDGIALSKSKYVNTLVGDGYAITINSSTNTVINRVLSLCSQACLDLTGTYPCIDTFISKCSLGSESRPVGIGIHENSYNMVVEDCTLAGMNAYGTVTVNRCRFVRNLRLASPSSNAIAMRGSHNPEWARFKITNCDFGDSTVIVSSLVYQEGIQPIDSVIGSIAIEDCVGGSFNINPSVNENILSNTINDIRLTNWSNCEEIYHKADNEKIKFLKISDCDFKHIYFINDHYDAHRIVLDNISYLDITNRNPLIHKVSVNKDTYGETLFLPKDVSIELSSDNVSAQYVVCGKNLVSDNADDYIIGTVTGAVGSSLSRTKSTGENVATVSIDGNGNPVYTQKANTNAYAFYPVGMVYVSEISQIEMSAVLKNSGATAAASFRPYIAIVDCRTGLVTYRGNGPLTQATAEGVVISHSYVVGKGSMVMCYFHCPSPVSGAVSTFEDYTVKLTPMFAPASDTNEAYTAKRITGDGIIKSLYGVNHIMSSETVFNVKLTADYINSAADII